MSFAGEVMAHGDEWTGNAVRLATREEADAYVRDLYCRWTAVRSYRVVESNDPVNYAWIDAKLVSA